MSRHLLAAALLIAVTLLPACRQQQHPHDHATPAPAPEKGHDPFHSTVIHDTRLQQTLSPNQLLEHIRQADVVLLGEQHDHDHGHRLQLAILQRLPAFTLSLEMIERDRAAALAHYLAAPYPATPQATEQFLQDAGLANWAGPGSGVRWYLPLIDTARSPARSATVIAANAPRHLVRHARRNGLPALSTMPAHTQRLAAAPEHPEHNTALQPYRTRFNQTMAAMHPAASQPDPKTLDDLFNAQIVWDATMADTVASAYHLGLPRPIVHIAGQFHTDYNGGLTALLTPQLSPQARILTISILPRPGTELLPEDLDRAHIVLYTLTPAP